ncbi:50S ribosomal protein L9 [Fretibacter rubidus]|uniref:50S ribosomal protein L9 n=1 Tax=Fretibacter rubidus TaxID=570162 RepID=UPI00352AB1B4
MDVILLERIEKLGAMGDVVSVKPGFARNFLLPQEKALRATKANKARFEAEREFLEARNAENAAQAAEEGKTIDGNSYVVIRNAGETGQLYGSVSARDIAETIDNPVKRSMVVLEQPIKALGLHEVKIRMHADVTITVTINVARSEDEAERQAAGEDVIAAQMEEAKADDREAAAERAALAVDMFEGDRDADFGDNEMPEERAEKPAPAGDEAE